VVFSLVPRIFYFSFFPLAFLAFKTGSEASGNATARPVSADL